MDNQSHKSAGLSAALDVLKNEIARAELERDESYQRGRETMAAEIIAAIKSLLHLPIDRSLAKATPSDQLTKDTENVKRRKSPAQRGKNGIAAQAVAEVFIIDVGLGPAEIHRKAVELGHVLSTEAVGNELRRCEGTKYRREGRKWFPLDKMETAEPSIKTSSAELPAQIGT